jgi:hypothetical protein
MRRFLVLAAPAAALLVAAPSVAQAPSGFYGGGTIDQRTVQVSMAGDGDALRFRFTAGATCPGRDDQQIVLVHEAILHPDGTFTRAGPVHPIGTVGERISGRFRVTGTVSATGVEGTVTATVRRTLHGHTRRCLTRWSGARFVARPDPHPSGARSTAAVTAPLYGTTSGRHFQFSGSVVVYPQPSGRLYMAWVATPHCTHTKLLQFENITPVMRPRADGTFGRHERFSLRYADGLVRFRADTAGQLIAGGATGTIRLRETLYSRRGRRLGRCDTGVESWGAIP